MSEAPRRAGRVSHLQQLEREDVHGIQTRR
jgi:hypothetical protein